MSFVEPIRTADSPDAELIAACNEYLRIERAVNEAHDRHGDDGMPDDDPVWALLDPIPRLVEKIVMLRPTTTEGIAALAKCMAVNLRPSHCSCQDDPDSAAEDRLQAALIRGLVALEMEVADGAP